MNIASIGSSFAANPSFNKIDQLLQQKKYKEAIDLSLTTFKLDHSQCRNILPETITGKDDQGREVTARTLLNQNVVLDPQQFAFKNARYLVSVLTHEFTHCKQHESAYQVAISTDPRLKNFAKKIPTLLALSDLEELAGRIVDKTNKNSSKDIASFQQKLAALKIEASPEQIEAYASDVVSDVVALNHTLNDLQEMEASLEAFHHSDVLPPPASENLADIEFAFQLRYLMTSTSAFMRHRALLGMKGDNLCRLINFVPNPLVPQYEKVCKESVSQLQRFLKNVPE